MKFDIDKEFEDYWFICNLRFYNCKNNGCGVFYLVYYVVVYDIFCFYKFFLCKFECGFLIFCGEMEVYVVIVCLMKIVKCFYYVVGCLYVMV